MNGDFKSPTEHSSRENRIIRMNPRILISLFSLLAATLQAQNLTLAEAIAVLPPQYQRGIVKVSADEANPNPERWYFTARNANKANDVYSLEVTNGRLTLEKPSFNFRALLGKPTAIDLARLKLDTPGIWKVASANCARRGRALVSASYVLEQEGYSADPIWKVWCYDSNGDEFAELDILATNGSIISSR